jgi:hypothetical protein
MRSCTTFISYRAENKEGFAKLEGMTYEEGKEDYLLHTVTKLRYVYL